MWKILALATVVASFAGEANAQTGLLVLPSGCGTAAFGASGAMVGTQDQTGRGCTVPAAPATVTDCGGSTSGSINTPTVLLAAGLAKQAVVFQNNGTVAVLFSFTSAGPLNSTNSFSLAAGASWSTPASLVPKSALTVQSGTASQPLACFYS